MREHLNFRRIRMPNPRLDLLDLYPFQRLAALLDGLAPGRPGDNGEPVVMVVAESRYLAEDALDAIFIEYEPLDAVVDLPRRGDLHGALLERTGEGVARRQARRGGST